MMAPQLPALEKNVLKYRALQMVLVLHEFESLKRLVIGSLRTTDRVTGSAYLPPGCKKPFEVALDVLISEAIIDPHEKLHMLEYATFRNRIGHEVYRLVEDVTMPDPVTKKSCLHDYWALTKLERLSAKISTGMAGKFILLSDLDGLIFEQAESTYKEELERLDRKIQRQIAVRLSRAAPNHSSKRTREKPRAA
jgi:hypothetical protein